MQATAQQTVSLPPSLVWRRAAWQEGEEQQCWTQSVREEAGTRRYSMVLLSWPPRGREGRTRGSRDGQEDGEGRGASVIWAACRRMLDRRSS